MNVYECDGEWSTDNIKDYVDTANAGANIIVSDGSVNNLNGSHVAKIYKNKEGEKKRWKQDGALYSYATMNINGEVEGDGVLNVRGDHEGISTELHLTINGGYINILAQDDGINASEENISITKFTGGVTRIVGGTGPNQGDGIDSNGIICIYGGTVISTSHIMTDSGVDTNRGCYVDGGTLVSMGGVLDWPHARSKQNTMLLYFKDFISSDSSIVIADKNGNIVFAYDIRKDDLVGSVDREYQGVSISSPNFVVGESYNLYIGSDIDGEEIWGLYNNSTAEKFSGGTKQICYSDGRPYDGSYWFVETITYQPSTTLHFYSTMSTYAHVANYQG